MSTEPRNEMEKFRILEKYGDLMSAEEKKELFGSSEPPSETPAILEANSKRKANSIAFNVFFSVFLSILTYIRVSEVGTKIPTLEYYFGFVLLCLVSIPQFLRLKWQYREGDRSVLYVRFLIAISLSWLLFSTVFYFALSPLLILLCVLLALAELIIHQPFHVMMRNEDLVSMAQAALRINCAFERMKTRSGFLPGIFTALLCILSLPLELMRKIASHSPRKKVNDEALREAGRRDPKTWKALGDVNRELEEREPEGKLNRRIAELDGKLENPAYSPGTTGFSLLADYAREVI